MISAFVSADADSFTIDSTDNDRAELVIKFSVTAFGADAYVVNVETPTAFATTATTTAPSTTEGVGYHIQYAGGVAVVDASGLAASTITSTAEEVTNSFLVLEGATETFTLKAVVTSGAAEDLSGGTYRAILAGIGFGNSDSATADFVYISDLDTFKTGYAIIAD